MATPTPTTNGGRAVSLVKLHSCSTQEELELRLAEDLAGLMPGASWALCLNRDDGVGLEARVVLGENSPLAVGQDADTQVWSLPDTQRFPIRFEGNELGQLWLESEPSPEIAAELPEVLLHAGTALVNLALNSEARQATDEYCATLQALEEGIVLFQEPDPEAMMARLLSLASTMVEAAAGALYVLEEVGNAKSALVLHETLGMPESLLEGFHGPDGAEWPQPLLDATAQIHERDDADNIAGLAPGCAPPVLTQIVSVPLRYHGVQAGICLLFNPRDVTADSREDLSRLQTFGQLAAALLHRVSLERMREDSVSIGRELEIAETIQKRLVPTDAPPSEGYGFAWSSLSAKSIGGDYVDFVTADVGEIHAIVADASGHGINSALLMTSFRANYRGNAEWCEPSDLAASLNNEVSHEVGPTGMFITAVMARIDPDSGRLSMCSAGHNPTMIYRAATGKVEQVDSHGPPLGFMANLEYEGYEGRIDSGDVLLLYTDGITEAVDGELDMFGEDRLEELLIVNAVAGTAEEILAATLNELAVFTGRTQHDDDVSLMVIKAK